MLARGKFSLFAVLAAFSLALVAGCGDDDEGSTTASGGGETSSSGSEEVALETSSLSKPVYLKRVSTACRKERASLVTEAADYLGKHESDGKPPAVLMANMARAVIVPKVEAEIAIVREAGAPAGDEQQIEEILADQEEATEEAKQLKTAKSIDTVLAVFSEPTRELRAYGFTSCTN